MSQALNITLPAGIEAPTSADVRQAKQYVLQRTQAEIVLADLIDEVLNVYVGRIVRLCYQYNIAPTNFNFAATEELRRKVYALLDDMEEEIFALIEDYAIPVSKKDKHHPILLAWLLSLGTHNWDFRTTLQYYIYRFSKDIEAAIAAMRYANINQTTAISLIRSALHEPYSLPQLMTAIKSGQFFSADMIRSGGIKTDPITHRPTSGLSRVGATNITTIARTTLSMAWMRSKHMEQQERGAAGYFVFRGSSYPCPACDHETTYFHPIQDGMVLPVHSHCCCFAVFVNPKDTNE